MKRFLLLMLMAGCAAERITHMRTGWGSCQAADSNTIRCGGQDVAQVECFHPADEACGALAIRYADGERVFLFRPFGFEAGQDDSALESAVVRPELASDGSKIWYRAPTRHVPACALQIAPRNLGTGRSVSQTRTDRYVCWSSLTMRHPSCRQLYDYWNEQRGLRAAPESARIEPGAIRHVLADTFTLDVDLHAGHPFHFVGTRVDAAFGRELKTQSFVNLWRTEYRDLVRNILAVVTDESLGVVASASAKSSEGIPLEFELLILPL